MSRQEAPPRGDGDRLIGTELGEYRIERLIGRGGMGVVYLALDDLDRHVALKLMLPELANNEDFRERFIRESQAVIDHPNVVTVYEAGEIESTLYLAMQYIDGIDLKALIEKEGRLLPARAVDIFKQAADALDAAHAQGLVHRDVKPQNMLIAPAGDDDPDHVYLSDFGLVKRTASQSSFTQSAYLMGTVQYMSPEQIEGRNVDGRADVYGLGCVLYEAVTGQIPFDKDSDVSVMWAHVNDPPPRPSSVVPVLPSTVDEVIAKALAKAPDDRYLTCGELVADLAQAFGVSSGKRSKPVWSSGAVAASLQHSRPGTGSKKTRRSPDAALPMSRPVGGWIAAAMAFVVAIGAVAFANRAPETPAQLTAEPGAAAPSLPADATNAAPEIRDGSSSERRRKRTKSSGDNTRGDRRRGGGLVSQPREGDSGGGDDSVASPPAAAPAIIVAPYSGNYDYTQQGYEQECSGTCSDGRNLPERVTVQSTRLPTGSDRVRVRTITNTSDRWRTEVVTDYFDDRVEIVSVEMRHGNTLTPAWRQRVEPAAPIQWLSYPLAKGKSTSGSWDDDLHAQDSATRGSYEAEVVGSPTISINREATRTFRVHLVVEFSGPQTGTWDLNLWVDPDTRAIVKTSGTIKIDTYEMSVVTTLKAGPGY